MTQNLRISDKHLTASDTDIASDFYLSASTTTGWNDNSFDSPRVYIYDEDIHPNFGGQYNWYGAIAESMTKEKYGNCNPSPQEDAPSSICPKSWRLPNIYEAQALISYYTPASFQSSPSNFTLTGMIDYQTTGFLTQQGTNGYYWTSSPHDPTNNCQLADPCNLNFSSSVLQVNSAYHSPAGYNVRCVSK